MVLKCPACGKENASSDYLCSACFTTLNYEKPIINSPLNFKNRNTSANSKPFTILSFLKDNFQLFTIIGVLGTMISLLPNLGDKILGEYWMTGDMSYLSIFLSFTILFGAILIAIIFLILILRLVENRESEDFTSLPRGRKWYKGDAQRIALTLSITPMMFGFIVFIVGSGLLIPSPYSLILGLMYITIIYTIAQGYLMYKISQQIKVISNIPKKWLRSAVVILYLGIIAVFVLTYLFVSPGLIMEHPYSPNIKIQPDQEYFSPLLSSSKGLQLKATNVSGHEQIVSTSYNWTTNYGFFVWISQSANRLVILGPIVENQNPQIYWTYPVSDIGKNKPPVEIKLQVVNQRDGSVVTKTTLNLSWYQQDIAFVNNSYVISSLSSSNITQESAFGSNFTSL